MSTNWVKDIHDMHTMYGFREKIKDLNPDELAMLLDFRADFLKEEMSEINASIDVGDSDGIVDGLIDLCVVAIGTLDLFGVDAYTAWDRVHAANISKEVGIKASRPNPLGLPDLVKPAGWESPVHNDNTGSLEEIFNE